MKSVSELILHFTQVRDVWQIMFSCNENKTLEMCSAVTSIVD